MEPGLSIYNIDGKLSLIAIGLKEWLRCLYINEGRCRHIKRVSSYFLLAKIKKIPKKLGVSCKHTIFSLSSTCLVYLALLPFPKLVLTSASVFGYPALFGSTYPPNPICSHFEHLVCMCESCHTRSLHLFQVLQGCYM